MVKKKVKVKKVVNNKKTKIISKKIDNKIKLIDFQEIKWTPSISVHEKTIDKQHQALFEQVNKLLKSLSGGWEIKIIRETLDFFDKYWKEHLIYEEQYLAKIKYPYIKKHKQIHADFVNFYKKFKQGFEEENNTTKFPINSAKKYLEKARKFLGNWLVNHIGKEDHKYYEYVKKKEIKGIVKKPIKTLIKKGKESIKEITQEVRDELIKGQRKHVEGILSMKDAKTNTINKYIMTGVPGFDDLLDQGIPRGSSIIVAGGTGSGKTILCLQTLNYHAKQGKKCMYITFEENEDRLINHMMDFGWDARKLIKDGNLKIIRMNPFDITRNVDALLAKQKGELLIDIDPMIIPEDFQPDIIAIDSLTAIASAFSGKDDSYRIYIEQLFRFLEQIGATNFLITETEQVPKIFSPTGVEEFLADGVFVLYSIKHGNIRENAIEILKLRGASHQKKIVAMQITEKGVVVYPEQEVFSEI